MPRVPLRASSCWIQSPSSHPRGALGNARPKQAGPSTSIRGADPLLSNCQVTHCRLPLPQWLSVKASCSCVSSRPRRTSGAQAETDWAPQDDVLGQVRGRWKVAKYSSESREFTNGTRAEAPRLRKTAEWAGPVVAVGPVAEEDPGPEQL